MNSSSMKHTAIALTISVTSALSLNSTPASAQDLLAQKFAAIQQASAANKQKLAGYLWQESETISIKGDVKDTKIYQVHIENGVQQKVLLNNASSAPPPSGGRIRQRVVANKTAEYADYGQQIGALAKQYTSPNDQLLYQAKQAGNISIQPGAGVVNLVIKNYIKPGDSVTMTVSEQTHAPVSVQINTYLTDTKDVVTVSAQFSQLPDGTNHVATATINGVSKQLTITQQNSMYRPL